MKIYYNETEKEFHLQNDYISYIIKIMKNNQLGHLYFGKRLNHRESFGHLMNVLPRAYTAYVFKDDFKFSLDLLRQEYPSYGTTDFREPAYQVKQENGSIITNFEYQNHKIYNGKPKLDGLPSTYTENDSEALTLEIWLKDNLIDMDLVLTYTIFEEYGVITRSARFINNGKQKLKLMRAMSMSIDLPDADYDMIHLSGAWARERYIKLRRLQPGIQSVSSIRGASSAQQNPFIALKRSWATEDEGEVFGFNLIYSGNFLAQVEVDYDNVTRVIMGIHPFNFGWILDSGESFQTPEAVMVYSDKGLNGMSQIFHKLYRNRLVRGKFRDEIRPILINNWEATYFNFDEKKILEIARTAKELGIELFVLDDGWFGNRNDDSSSLGDWFENREKLPNGIKGLAEKITAMGMKFGLWIEPEMVNKDSILYSQHPDWIIQVPGRRVSHGRNQYVLDFSRKEVVNHIYEMISKILREAPISYVKWDMNRNITEPYSVALPPERQGEVFHRYILGVYSLYEKLTSEFPDILFESCAGGGGRFDPGMLYYAPQAWASDNTDAVERLKIQYGTSICYPINAIGSHVSAVPNHQVGRITPIETRANVAYFGTFGFELDLSQLTYEEKDKIKEQIKFFKKYRELIHKGTFYRINSPFEGDGNITSWMVVSEDLKEAIIGYYQVLAQPNQGLKKIRLKGLDTKYLYRIVGSSESYYGDELMYSGLPLDDFYLEIFNRDKEDSADFMSKVYVIKAEE
ncbi:Alpha-galactosidase [Thermoanaerobacterium xylanolyticum LX-11]|uniref:Alpha-galactosidase n=1 Tax=Thermoanaerobacterium xylanolyticum (strain ATCC 49914 / DSM 7097 / LX-11) TaxID=858215 RepID=F6BK23_THEXL|nr:alpha-galactosidase [Thermoanaerobacterium xylanolyticum]AEF18044.1 Alpha-galactosidase [Thermoanaerobacterium xylanolyticum LX-11]